MSFRTRDGRNWRPDYLVSIDPNKCIGCGRCYKICGREVMTLKGLSERVARSSISMRTTMSSKRRSWC
ncbi:Nif-specific ferredoxin III [Bradyrhizobium sp. GM6.1]